GKVMGFCLAVTGIKSSNVFWNRLTKRFPSNSDISWLNQVERFFGLLTDRRIRRGTFGSVRELETAIRDYRTHTPSPSPAPQTPTSSSKRSLPFVCELPTRMGCRLKAGSGKIARPTIDCQFLRETPHSVSATGVYG